MKLSRVVGVASVGLFLGGCAAPLVGTWKGRDSDNKTSFSFGSVSFVGDKTFTAEAKYANDTKVQSGTWQTEGDRLILHADKQERRYTYKVNDGELTVTEPKSGHSITLDRMGK